MRVWVVISALTQVTNKLQHALEEAVTGVDHLQSFQHILKQHIQLAQEIGIIEAKCVPELLAIGFNGNLPISTPLDSLLVEFQVCVC